MRKIFCDVCEKEIYTVFAVEVKYSVENMQKYQSDSQFFSRSERFEVCSECRNNVHEIINNYPDFLRSKSKEVYNENKKEN